MHRIAAVGVFLQWLRWDVSLPPPGKGGRGLDLARVRAALPCLCTPITDMEKHNKYAMAQNVPHPTFLPK